MNELIRIWTFPKNEGDNYDCTSVTEFDLTAIFSAGNFVSPTPTLAFY